MNKDNIAQFYRDALDFNVRQWKAGKMSDSEYNRFMSRAYEKLKGLGMTDQEAKDILTEIERKAA